MKRLSQTLKIGLAMFMAVFSSGLVQLYTAPNASAYTAPTEEPITQVMICHAREGSKPYGPGNEQTVSINSAGELQGGHNNHTGNGQVWSPTNTTNFSDIIPPFYYLDGNGVKQHSSGLGWSTEGQLIYANNCDVSNNTDKTVTPVAPTVTKITACGTYGSIVFANTPHVTYALEQGDGKQGDYKVTATADEGYTVTEGAATEFTGNLGNYTTCPRYYLQTSHDTSVCGKITITLRNVSPWIYPVSYSTDGSTPNVNGPEYGPVVDNSGDAPDDQTGSKTLTFTEDSNGGTVTVKYVVAAGAESNLYKNLPVGQVTTVEVNTDCLPPADVCLNLDGIQATVPENMTRSEDGNCYKKVFVCKYVGKPGVDERLKEGENPISVSVNAIEHSQWDGTIPGWFSDAQDRSYVLGYDDGEFNPTAEDCILKAAASSVEYLLTPCVANTNSTDFLRVRVTNTADDTKNSVEYTVTVKPVIGANISKKVTVADGGNSLVEFANLPAGTYTVEVSASDDTLFASKSVVINQCTLTPGSGSGNGQTLGGATDVKTPTVLPTTIPATGADGAQNQLVIVLAALTAYGATFFFQNRRKLSADEA